MPKWSGMQEAIFADQRDGSRNTCVDALAGSGKSTTLVECLKQIKSSSVLVTSFSVACVEDLRKKEPPWTVDVKTMNSLGNRALIDSFNELKIDNDRVWNILDYIIGKQPENLDAARTKDYKRFRTDVKQLVDLAKNHLSETSDDLYELADEFDIDDTVAPWMAPTLRDKLDCAPNTELVSAVFKTLDECKKINGVIDYNDQLWLPIVHDIRLEPYKRIYVDEVQDTSPVQIELLCRSLQRGGRVCMFGDDHQALYAFRGAGIGVGPFAERVKARHLPLSVSYRCPRAVIALAQTIVPEIQAAPDAPEGLVQDVTFERMINEIKPGQTVLSRSNAPLVSLFLRLLRERVPVAMKGKDLAAGLGKFIEKSNAKNVKELRDYTVDWRDKEIARRTKNNPDARVDGIHDKASCILILCDASDTMSDVESAMRKLLFPPDKLAVLLSTVHKAKGLEWDHVWLLQHTFPIFPAFWMQFAKGEDAREWASKMASEKREREPAERNVFYVAVTRSKMVLNLVSDRGAL